MGGHVFVDETKRRGYVVVGCLVRPGDIAECRKMLRRLVLPGQRRLHMKAESDPRRRVIATAVAASGVRATIYDAGRRYGNDLDRRAACLAAVVNDAVIDRCDVLVLERDDTLHSWDNQRLIEAVRASGRRHTLRYEHRRAVEEQLLALPDVIAWCWARGGDWRRRIAPVVAAVRIV